MNSAAVDLTLVEHFLNTLDERSFTVHGEKHIPSDALTSVGALSTWLSEHDLGSELTEADLATALALRSTLRKTLIRDDESVAQPLSGFPLSLAADGNGDLRLTAHSGVAGLDVILETVATAVATNGWKRLKLCASADCHWAFYDTSRSGGGRWCDMEVCGNRHKTRAYRRRRIDPVD